ncbi:MAG: hypothetical protein ACRDNS_25095, partial [Trebonia sp.]
GTLTGRPAWVSAADAPAAGWALSTYASDPGGVCGLEISVASQQAQANVAPDYTQASPCGASPRPVGFTLNPCALPDGAYTLSESATNPAGMVGYGPYNGETINIDCTPPSTSVASAPAAARWYSSAQQVTFAGSDNYAGVGQMSCNDGPHAGSSYTEAASAQGTHTVSCSAIDNAANVGNTASATVHIDYQAPTVAFTGPGQSGWASGTQGITATGSEAQALSGVASVSCAVDGAAAATVSGASQLVKIASDGTHTITCQATTGAGVTGPKASYTVHVDNDPPTLEFSGGPPQSAWETSSQAITVSAADQPELSGLKEIQCSLAGVNDTSTASPIQI